MNPASTQKRPSRFRAQSLAALALIFLLASPGCSTTTIIRPGYKPGASSKPAPASGSVSLRVVDKIDNQAPLSHQTTALERTAKIVVFGPVFGSIMRDVDTGQQLVSDAGPYKLDESPAQVTHRVFKGALERSGLRVVEDGAPDTLEVQLLRFEFVLGTRKGESKIKAIANVLLEAGLRHGEGKLPAAVILEQGEKSFGLAMTPGEIEGYISETLSQAAEHAISDAKAATILDKLRAGAK